MPSPNMEKSALHLLEGMPPTNWGTSAILLPRVVDCKEILEKSDVNDNSDGNLRKSRTFSPAGVEEFNKKVTTTQRRTGQMGAAGVRCKAGRPFGAGGQHRRPTIQVARAGQRPPGPCGLPLPRI